LSIYKQSHIERNCFLQRRLCANICFFCVNRDHHHELHHVQDFQITLFKLFYAELFNI